MTDYKAAQELKSEFILREHDENQEQFSKLNLKKIKDFSELM